MQRRTPIAEGCSTPGANGANSPVELAARVKQLLDIRESTNANAFHPKQRPEFVEFAADVPYPDGTVVGRPVCVPGIHEISRAEGEPVTAVRVADFEDGPGHRFTFRNE